MRHLVAGDDHADAFAVERLLLRPTDPVGDLEQVGDEIGGASIQWSTSSIGTTSTCPRASGLIDMNATQRSSRYTNVPGISPAMMRLKMVVMDDECTLGRHGSGQRWRRTRYLTMPNAFTLVRLCCIPLFLYLLFGRDNRAGAAWLLGGLGATDWVDGWLARRLDQTSEFGKMFDPTVDRLLFIVGDRRHHHRRRGTAVDLRGPSSSARCSSAGRWRSPRWCSA